MKVYEVWEGCTTLLGDYPEGLDEDSVLDVLFSTNFDPVFIDTFNTLEQAQKRAQKVERPVRCDGFICLCYRYIEELEYEDDTNCPTESGVVDYFAYGLEQKDE